MSTRCSAVCRSTTRRRPSPSPVTTERKRSMSRPVVAITMGDAAGVGPEVIVKALTRQEVYERCRPLVIGDAGRLRKAVEVAGVDLEVSAVEGPEDGRYQRGTVDVIDLDC